MPSRRDSVWPLPRGVGIGGDGLRFLLAGAGNALLTFAAYQLLLFVMPPSAAYALAWLFGLAIVIVVYPSKVFTGARTDAVARLHLGLTYVAMFLLGIATLKGLAALSMSPRVAIVIVMAVTTLANFILGRFVLRRRQPRSAGASP